MTYNDQSLKITLKNAYQEFMELGVRASHALHIKNEGKHLAQALHVYNTLANKVQTTFENKLFCEFEALEKKYEPIRKKVIQKLAKLTSIQLRGQIGRELRTSLAIISSYCPNLKNLDLSDTDIRGDELKHVPKCLEILSLSGCKWLEERSLITISSLRRLKELDFSYTKITGTMVIFLPQSLQKLIFLGCHLFKEENILYIHPTIQLKTLDVRLGYSLSGKHFDGLNNSLTHLILPADFRFSFKNIHYLLNHPNLQQIDLSTKESIKKADFASLKKRALANIQPRIRGISLIFAQEAQKVRNSLKIDLKDIAQAIFDKTENENKINEEDDEELRFLMSSHQTEAMKKVERAKKETLLVTKALCRLALQEKNPNIKFTSRVIVENILADLMEREDDEFALHMKMQYGLQEEEFPKILTLLEELKKQAKQVEHKQ